MLSLSPAKLLVILVIALIVLGPEKLPQLARQLGAAWHDLRGWRTRIESEVRGTFPNLPPTHEVAQAVRSPFAFLDRLADEHERAAGAGVDEAATAGDADADADGAGSAGPVAPGAAAPFHGSATNGSGGSAAANGSDGPGTAAGGAGSSGPPAVPGATPSTPARPGVLPAAPDDPSMN